jgi:hypothetical protein
MPWQLGFHQAVFYFDTANGIDTDKRITVFGGMVIGTLQQDSVPETVPQAQVNAYRRVHISQHLFYPGLYLNFFHKHDVKSPACGGALNMRNKLWK